MLQKSSQKSIKTFVQICNIFVSERRAEGSGKAGIKRVKVCLFSLLEVFQKPHSFHFGPLQGKNLGPSKPPSPRHFNQFSISK
jgi:hypothetical protein